MGGMAWAGVKPAGAAGQWEAKRAGGLVVTMIVPIVLVVVTVMIVAIVLVVMAAHPGVGVQHVRVHVTGRDDWRLRGPALAAGERRRSQNGNSNQRCGNGLEHGCLLSRDPLTSPAGWPGSPITQTTLAAAR